MAGKSERKHHLKWQKQLRYYLLLLASLLLASSLLGCSLLDKTYKSDKAEDYESFISMSPDASRFMPKADDLGNYESVMFGFKRHIISVVLRFDSLCISVFASFDRKNYEAEKEKALAQYEFLKEPVFDGECYLIPVVSFEYKGYSFRITSEDHYFPKSFMMVGVNDEKATIAYLYYHDSDLDYISEKNASEATRIKCMQDLVSTSFAWE